MKVKNSLFLIFASLIILSTACDNKNADTQEIPPTENTPTEIAATPGTEQAVVSANNNDTITLPSGLKIIITKEGDGPRPNQGKKVTVHYTGFLTDGTIFDSSVDKNQPLEFNIGTGAVIRGWDEGVSMLNVGSKARLIIPNELAYGVNGIPGVIPPSATLIFDVELLGAE